MWEQVFKIAISNGIFAVLFVALLVFQLKDSARREKKYQATIEKLSKHLDLVEEINNDIKEIRSVVFNSGGAKNGNKR